VRSGLDNLIDFLDLEPLEVNLFRGTSPQNERTRIFGGQVLAQALMAAGRTVDAERAVHSMHAYFLRPGDPRAPVIFDVDRIRDGRSFTTRRVVAIQHGEAILNAAASFQVAETGPEHSDHIPTAPDPETLEPSRSSPWAAGGNREGMSPWAGEQPIDIRFSNGDRWSAGDGPRPPDEQMWLRASGRLPDDPLLHATVAAYASDIALLGTTVMPHTGRGSGDFMMASIDHVMWFHRPFRADEWLLFDLHSPVAGRARGFAHGSVFLSDGSLGMSIAQEGLLRPRR
jgi:acyl-CoA thioesterase II